MTLATAVETHLHHLRSEQQLDRATVSARRTTLMRLLAHVPDGALLEDLTRERIKSFLAAERGAGLAAGTVAGRRLAVIQFCRHMHTLGLVDAELVAAIPRIRRGSNLPRPASIADIETLIESITGESPAALRDRAMVEVAYSAGLRVSELVGLTLDRFDPAGQVRVIGKGRIERLAPIGVRAVEAVAAYLATGRPALAVDGSGDTLFLNHRGCAMGRMGFWLMLRQRSRSAGLARPIHPHMLRHSCATHMLEHGADLRVVQETLGHRSIASTQVYTHVTRERLNAEHRKHHPRG